MIGVKLSNLRNQHEVKKDKQLTEFFKSKLTKEEFFKQNMNSLNQI